MQDCLTLLDVVHPTSTQCMMHALVVIRICILGSVCMHTSSTFPLPISRFHGPEHFMQCMNEEGHSRIIQ